MNSLFVRAVRQYATLPRKYYNFVNIRDINALDTGKEVDVVAVVKDIEDASRSVVGRHGNEMKVKEATLVDQSLAQIRVTLWGKHASFTRKEDPMVLVARYLKVSDYRVKSLSTGMGTKLTGRATFPEVNELKKWWEETGSKLDEDEFVKLTKPSPFQLDEFQIPKTIKETTQMTNDWADPFTVKASILDINAEECIYKSCPNCNTGLSYPFTDPVTNLYTCQKCEKQFKKFKPKMRLVLDVGDMTSLDLKQVIMYGEVGRRLLGLNTQELADLCKPEHEYWWSQIFRGVVFKTFLFRVKRRPIDLRTENELKEEWVCYDLKMIPPEPRLIQFWNDITMRMFMPPDLEDRPADIWEADGDGSDSDAPAEYYYDLPKPEEGMDESKLYDGDISNKRR